MSLFESIKSRTGFENNESDARIGLLVSNNARSFETYDAIVERNEDIRCFFIFILSFSFKRAEKAITIYGGYTYYSGIIRECVVA